ncbi:UNVERIFIED_CONTAM: hypothetical protein FKN15_052508 [Acipenser sinensis]
MPSLEALFDKFPSKLVPITYKKPDWRTEEELKQLRNALSSVQSYRRYSNNLQLLLAKVIRHQRFGRRRVVIKKGHIGNSFYFIYSGVVAVTKDEEGSSAFVDKEPTLIRRGAGFGEVSLLKGVKRNATIVCMEETELLVVDKEDFFAKKLDEELKKEFEYRFSFYRSLDLLSSWSFQMIESMADHSKTEEFHYGRVIVKDTSDMANIIFMAKGRCDLLHIVDLTTCHSYKKWISQQTEFLKCDKRQFAPAAGTAAGTWSPSPAPNTEWKLAALNRSTCNRFPRQAAPLLTPYGEIPKDLGAAVCIKVDSIHQGEIFGLNQYLGPDYLNDKRSMILVSQGAEILRVKRENFDALVDQPTLAKLKKLQNSYPSDDILCSIFLEQSRWKIFKKDVVHLLTEQQVKPVLGPGLSLRSKELGSLPVNLDAAGILNLSMMSKCRIRSARGPHCQTVLVKKVKKGSERLPSIDQRLIHGIAIPRPNLSRLFA